MQRSPSDTDNKLLLLHAIDRLGPVTAQQLLMFMVEIDAMDYISIQLGLAELVDAALLRKQSHAVGILYVITGKGRDSLALFTARIPPSRMFRINENAEAWRLKFRREKQILSSFSKTETGDYLVRLRLVEWDRDLLNLEISVPTHKQAQMFCDSWARQAASVYAHIVYSLGETVDDAEA